MLNQQLDSVFHALSDPTRRAIVERLSRGATSVSELARPLSMSLPAVIQHLQLLEESGLVRSEKKGRVRTCSVDPAMLRKLEEWVAARRATWERHFDRLGEYLAQPNEKPSRRKP
jgi:DNA-binding transcriptional ArsR family regulator